MQTHQSVDLRGGFGYKTVNINNDIPIDEPSLSYNLTICQCGLIEDIQSCRGWGSQSVYPSLLFL